MRPSVLGMVGLLAAAAGSVAAQVPKVQLPIPYETWTRPFPALRIVGDLYYVGTSDLASYLIRTADGHISSTPGSIVRCR